MVSEAVTSTCTVTLRYDGSIDLLLPMQREVSIPGSKHGSVQCWPTVRSGLYTGSPVPGQTLSSSLQTVHGWGPAVSTDIHLHIHMSR